MVSCFCGFWQSVWASGKVASIIMARQCDKCPLPYMSTLLNVRLNAALWDLVWTRKLWQRYSRIKSTSFIWTQDGKLLSLLKLSRKSLLKNRSVSVWLCNINFSLDQQMAAPSYYVSSCKKTPADFHPAFSGHRKGENSVEMWMNKSQVMIIYSHES